MLDQQPDDLNTPHANVADTDSPQFLADGFLVEKCAGAVITSIEIWGGWGGTQPATDTFTIRFHDTTALFGNVAWQGPLNPPNVTMTQVPIQTMAPTGQNIYAYYTSWTIVPEYHLTLQLPQPVTVEPGLSWMSLAADGDTNSKFCWSPGFADANGRSSQYANYTQPSGSWSPPTVFATRDFGLVIHGVTNGTGLCADNFVVNSTATVSVEDAPANTPVFIGLSLTGNGPIPTPYGNLLLSAPQIILPVLLTDPSGAAAHNIPIPAYAIGLQIWFQAIEVTGPSLTNGVHVVIS
ncbi:MAG: hypothetical protein KDC98_24520 [Planctomycetes bacterium]|nr:hypothetical protein [Planctomycetota bacterium]